MVFWKKFDASDIMGNPVKGDPESRQDSFWNYFFLIAFLWKKVCVLQVNTDQNFYLGYYIIGKNGEKAGKIFRKVFYNPKVRIGHRQKNCFFFAVNEKGEELGLSEIAHSISWHDPKYKGIRAV